MAKGRRLYGIQPFQTLVNVTSAQTSSGVALGAAFSGFGMQVISAASSFACELQISITGGSSEFRTAGTIDSSCGDISGDMIFTADQPVHHVRTNLIRNTTAETTVWVSVTQ